MDWRAIAAGVTIVAGMAGPAVAAGDPDAARGIVAEYCTGCHEVPGYQARHGRAEVDAPSFQAMADEPEAYPPEQIAAFLRRPHFPMTQFVLSPSDIDNIVAFIEGLRGG